MGPAVMLGQDPADVAWPVGEGAVAELAAVTGSWVTVTGKRRERDVLITSYDASPAGVTWPHARSNARLAAEARIPRQGDHEY